MKMWLVMGLMALLPTGVFAQDHTATVADIKAQLVARGVNLDGPCGAFQITGRVAFVLRSEGWGLVSKNPGQNGCTVTGHERYAVDAIMTPDGTTVDILINSETQNIPAWQVVGSAPASSYRAPFAMDGDVVIPPAPVPPAPMPTPAPAPSTIQSSLDRIEQGVIEVRTSLAEHRAALQRVLVWVAKYLGPAAGTALTFLMNR